jgi:KilA-N domain
MTDNPDTTNPSVSSDIIVREFNNVSISQRADGYLDATAMCRANGRRWVDYARAAGTEPFINALSETVGISHRLLIEAKEGRNGGTYVHPQVAYHLAMWCSPAFAVQVTEWVHDIKTKGYATAPGVSLNAEVLKVLADIDAELAGQRKAVAELSSRVDGLLLTTDARRGTGEMVAIRQLLDQAKCITRGRNSVARKLLNALKNAALVQQPPVRPRRCPHTGVWLFPVDFANDFMARVGNIWAAAHNAAITGQGSFDFEKPKPKRTKRTGPDISKPEGRA